MPELPEIYNLSVQMNTELMGKRITDIQVLQEKCINIPKQEFGNALIGKKIYNVSPKGKWIFIRLEGGLYLLLNLGMGGNMVLHKPDERVLSKYQLKLEFDSSRMLTIGFWWFGHCHAVWEKELDKHKLTAALGLNPLNDEEYTIESFKALFIGKKGAIKPFLTDQANIAGIGNVYIHDILFDTGIHPLKRINTISEVKIRLLYDIISSNLKKAARLGGLAYEKDLYNRPGRVTTVDFKVGYREGCQCPQCKTVIEKIKTGSTSSYICPKCQSI